MTIVWFCWGEFSFHAKNSKLLKKLLKTFFVRKGVSLSKVKQSVCHSDEARILTSIFRFFISLCYIQNDKQSIIKRNN